MPSICVHVLYRNGAHHHVRAEVTPSMVDEPPCVRAVACTLGSSLQFTHGVCDGELEVQRLCIISRGITFCTLYVVCWAVVLRPG